MPTVRHPRDVDGVAGHPPDRVTVRGDAYAVDGDPPTVELPSEGHVRDLAAAYDLAAEELRVTETCQAVKTDGDVCGRELPCAYHSD